MTQDTDNADQSEKVEEVWLESCRRCGMPGMPGLLQLKVGHDDPINIHKMHQNDPTRRCADSPRGSLGGLRKKEKEGDKEMSDDQKNGVPKPSTRVAVDKKPSLLRNICIPLEKVLAE